MKRKILAIGLVVCMLVVAIGSATMAYFTDTETANNVMTVGKIDIVQHEKEEDRVTDFEQDKTLLPNVTVDKVVTVENTGNSAAYFRTFVAFEGTKEFVDTYLTINALDINNGGLEQYGEIQIGAGVYTLYIYTPSDALVAGDKSAEILVNFTLSKDATQEDVAFAGDIYNVWVVTEAVQADGFENGAADALNTAFGTLGAQADVYTGYHPFGDTSWYSATATEYTLTDRADLLGFASLVNDGTSFSGKTVKIDADIDLGGIDWAPLNLWNPEKPGMTINGNGHTISNLTVEGGSQIGFIGSYAGTGDMVINDLTFENANVTGTGSFIGTVIGYQYGNVTMNNVDVKNSVVEASIANVAIRAGGLVGASFNHDGATLNLIDCDSTGNTISAYHNAGGLVGTSFTNAVTMTNCTSTDNTFYYGGSNTLSAQDFDCNGYAEGASVKNACTTSGNTYVYVAVVSDDTQLENALENAANGKAISLANGDYTTNLKIDGGKNVTLVGSGEDTVLSGQIATTSSTAGTLTIKNMTIKVDDSIVDSTGISQTGKSAIAIWGNQTVICENVTFDMSLANSTAITSWWDTNEGTTIIVKDCTFNCNGQRPIRATGNVTVENCTFNDPYRYAVQLTAKASTATLLDKAIVNFNNNTIVNGPNGKTFVYGIQLEGEEYGCNDLVINGAGNTIVDGGTESTMYYCECGKVEHTTVEFNTEVVPVHKN